MIYKDLYEKDYLRVFKEIVDLDTVCSESILTTSEETKLYFMRLAYDQFVWQKYDFNLILNKYYHIYSEEHLNNRLKDNLWFYIEELYEVWIMYYAYFLIKGYVLDPSNRINSVMQENMSENALNYFQEHFIIDKDDIQKRLEETTKLNQDMLHSNKIRIWLTPIIRLEKDWKTILSCPIPIQIIRRLTEWIRYNNPLLERGKCWDLFWKSHELYIKKIYDSLTFSKISIWEWDPWWARINKNSVDRYIYDTQSIIFIEAKTYQLAPPSKELSKIPRDFLNGDWRKIY